MPGALQDYPDELIALAFCEQAVNQRTAPGTVTTAQTVAVGVRYTAYTLGANLTINLPTPAQGLRVDVDVTQDATGTRVPTFATPSGAIKWPGAVTPTWSTLAGRTDAIAFVCRDGVNWVGIAQINVG